MKKKINTIGLGLLALFLSFALSSCAPLSEPQSASGALMDKYSEPPAEEPAVVQLPVRFQSPGYSIKPLSSSREFGSREDSTFPVGADISSSVPIALRDIMKQLVQIKGMNLSWANDVDQSATVDVDIRAEEDFYNAIDNLLRQLDYFHDVRGNTIIVKYKETKKYHVSMPFVASSYSVGLGGDVLGSGTTSGNMQGQIQVTSSENKFDVWKNIEGNLDKVLEIWTEPTPIAPPAAGAPAQPAATPAPVAASSRPQGKGYYTIDRPIGLITVTAPRSLQDKITTYIDNLTSELYRQVSIEAKILEVTLDSDNTTGIDWETLLNSSFSFSIDFQKLSPSYPGGEGRFLTLSNKGFSLFLDAIKTQGQSEVIANPKISVMNGQPALINIGENKSYVDSVTTTISDSGIPSTSVTTSSVMSGLGLAVVPTIMDNNEIIMTLTPVTSKASFTDFVAGSGLSATTLQLPNVNIRGMNTIVRVKDGEMLVIGGLIDSTESDDSKKIPGLGDVPGIGKLFGTSGTVVQRKELVIFLSPRII